MRISPLRNYLNTDAAKDHRSRASNCLRNQSGRIGFISCSIRGPHQNNKLIPLRRLTAFGSIAVSRGHLVRRGVVMLQSNHVPETQRLGSTEEVSLNHLAGIRTFIEGCGRIDSISEEMRELVSSRWPDLMRKLSPKD